MAELNEVAVPRTDPVYERQFGARGIMTIEVVGSPRKPASPARYARPGHCAAPAFACHIPKDPVDRAGDREEAVPARASIWVGQYLSRF